MPYIPQQDRSELLQGDCPVNAGELNFLFSNIINAYFVHQGLTYKAINEVIGALECCKMEVYRRIAEPYENGKIKTNGDVFDVTLVKDKDD